MKDVSGARSSSIGTFSTIARENYQKFLKLQPHLQEIKERTASSDSEDEKSSNEFKLMKLEEETEKCIIQVIVFSAIAIEAYIYDYGSRNLSDAYVKKHLDRLDPISKWVIIPQLVTGKELPRNHRWFELLTKLTRERNCIIHPKSSTPPIKFGEAIPYYDTMIWKSEQTYHAAGEAIELLNILPNEMRAIDPGEIGWINIYFASKPDDQN